MTYNDVDRNDLHQIHSYSGYYRNNLIASGLLYPLSKDIKEPHTETLYGNNSNEIKFIVDGIYVRNDQSMKALIEAEKVFIQRITNTLKTNE